MVNFNNLYENIFEDKGFLKLVKIGDDKLAIKKSKQLSREEEFHSEIASEY